MTVNFVMAEMAKIMLIIMTTQRYQQQVPCPLQAFTQTTALLFPKAYKENLHGYKYVWIIVGWYNDDWWRRKNDVDCTGEQMRRAAANLIETSPLPLSSSGRPTVSQWVGSRQ